MILEKTIVRTIAVSKAVAMWNLIDHEHLDVVHGNYKEAHVLFEKEGYFVSVYKVKLPLIPFLYIKSPVFGVVPDENTYINYFFQFGIDSKLTYKFKELKKDYTKIKVKYQFNLTGIKLIFYPLLKFMISKWNEGVWLEDLPVKIRRQKVLRMGFKDFHGLPDKIEDRFYNGPLKYEMPVKRPRYSSRDRHPFKINR